MCFAGFMPYFSACRLRHGCGSAATSSFCCGPLAHSHTLATSGISTGLKYEDAAISCNLLSLRHLKSTPTDSRAQHSPKHAQPGYRQCGQQSTYISACSHACAQCISGNPSGPHPVHGLQSCRASDAVVLSHRRRSARQANVFVSAPLPGRSLSSPPSALSAQGAAII